MINVVAVIAVQDGKGAELERLFAEARPGVLAEQGCRRYDLQRKRRSETEYVVLEAWSSTSALRVHGESEAFAVFAKALGGLVASAPLISVYDPVGEQTTP